MFYGRPVAHGWVAIAVALFVAGCSVGGSPRLRSGSPSAPSPSADRAMEAPRNHLSRPVPGPDTGGCPVLEEAIVRRVTGYSLTDLTVRITDVDAVSQADRITCLFTDTLSNSVVLSASPEAADGRAAFESAVGVMDHPVRLSRPGEAAAWQLIGYQGRMETREHGRHLSLAVILLGVPPDRLLAIATTLAEAILPRI